MVDRLKADMLYPDCPRCETNLLVGRKPGIEEEFECIWCGEQFDPPASSLWCGVSTLPRALRRDHVAVKIRKFSPEEWASVVGVRAKTVRRNARRAQQRLKTVRRSARKGAKA